MFRSLETVMSIICVVLLCAIIPIMLQKRSVKVTTDSLAEKKAAELAYQIEHYKEIRLDDLYSFEGELNAYEDNVGGEPVMTTWREIYNAMMADPEQKYVFKEKYVQILYNGDNVITLRVN